MIPLLDSVLLVLHQCITLKAINKDCTCTKQKSENNLAQVSKPAVSG